MKKILFIYPVSSIYTHYFMKAALADVGEVTPVYSADEALELLRHDSFDGIFTGLSGIGVKNELYPDLITRLKWLGRCPVIVYTSQTISREKEICLEAGAADFIEVGSSRATSGDGLRKIINNL